MTQCSPDLKSHNSQFSSFKCRTLFYAMQQEIKQEVHPLKRLHCDFLTKNIHEVHVKQRDMLLAGKTTLTKPLNPIKLLMCRFLLSS